MIEILPIPAFQDNYIWLCINKSRREAIVVDPGDAKPVLTFLAQHQLSLVAIFITHKHADHVGGVSELVSIFPRAFIYASEIENIIHMTHSVRENSEVWIPKWPLTFSVMDIPGHTLGHVAYFTDDILFCGDTLFGAGCGRVFEGTAKQMLRSLKKISALPNTIHVYCGHEYTMSNLKFAHHVEPHNLAIQKRIQETQRLRDRSKPSIPSTMQLEKNTNPFLRCTEKEIIQSVEIHANKKLLNEVDVFAELRAWKNNF